jgi:hypothetical protein
MIGYLRIVGLCCCVAAGTAAVRAADIGRLEWGSFIVDADTADGMADWRSEYSDDGHRLSMTFGSFAAKADGAVMEAQARFSGYFGVIQPDYDPVASLHVELQGFVIKSAGASVSLVMKIGASDKEFVWPASDVSEKFTKSFDLQVPGGTRLPSPFPISAEIHVSKSGKTDAAYLSLESLTLTTDTPKVALK